MKHGHDWQFDQQMANGQDQDEEVELLWQMLRKIYLMQLKINFLHKISVTSDGRSIVTKIRLVNTSCCPSIMCNEAYLRHWCVPSAVLCNVVATEQIIIPLPCYRDTWHRHTVSRTCGLVTGHWSQHGNTAAHVSGQHSAPSTLMHSRGKQNHEHELKIYSSIKENI